jgi:DNA-binding winged helix-turn-helix (wHTH) protein
MAAVAGILHCTSDARGLPSEQTCRPGQNLLGSREHRLIHSKSCPRLYWQSPRSGGRSPHRVYPIGNLNTASAALIAFDDIEFDPSAETIHCSRGIVQLPARLSLLLHYLIEHRGRILEGPELCHAIWDGKAVSRSAIERAIEEIRQLLGGGRGEQQIIRMHPAGGVEFVAPLKSEACAIESDFVGRDAAIELLDAEFEKARSGSGRVTLIRGEGGIGKTRLASEFAVLLARRHVPVSWGHCSQGSAASIYGPWVELLRELLSRDSEAVEALRPVAAAKLLRVMPALGEILDPDGAIQHYEGSVSLGVARTDVAECLQQALRLLSRNESLVLIFDDFHRADRESWIQLSHMARAVAALPIQLVATLREHELQVEEREVFPPT